MNIIDFKQTTLNTG